MKHISCSSQLAVMIGLILISGTGNSQNGTDASAEWPRHHNGGVRTRKLQ